MLLIKYFKNTKAIRLETQESFAEGPSSQKTPIAGNGHRTEPPARGKHSAKLCARSLPISDDLLFVQAHGWTLVHAHVRITKKSACTALNPSGIQRVQVLQRHLQVLSHFRAGCHLWNVEAILTT